MDFDIITDLQLTFSPSVSSLPVSVNISSDGLFEEDVESFSATLSTRISHLQLRNASVNLRQIACEEKTGLNIFTIPNNTAEKKEELNIALDRVILTQTVEGAAFSLTNNKSDRVSVIPEVAKVAIIDHDGKHIAGIVLVSVLVG